MTRNFTRRLLERSALFFCLWASMSVTDPANIVDTETREILKKTKNAGRQPVESPNADIIFHQKPGELDPNDFFRHLETP